VGPVLEAPEGSFVYDERAPGDDPLLEARDVTIGFGGVLALDEVSMSIGTGEVVGVIGPNGAGKTTLFNVICGFVHPSSGHIAYRGRDLHRHHPHDLAKLGIARTLQGVGLCAGLTVLENVMLGAQPVLRSDPISSFLGLWRSSREERATAQRAMGVLDDLGIAAYAERLPPSLPYATQKNTALARASLGSRVRSLTTTMSVLLVEHHMDLVMAVCDRIVVLNFGRVIAHGTPEVIRADPEVATAYLGDEIEETGTPANDGEDRA
jgi:branched-chain amino acid transport system ATP-binding protein